VVAYRARSRLLNLGENKVLWQAECPVPRRVRGAKSSLDVKSLPTLEQLLADGGAALKAQLEKQADACAEDLIEQLTGRPAVTKPSPDKPGVERPGQSTSRISKTFSKPSTWATSSTRPRASLKNRSGFGQRGPHCLDRGSPSTFT